jgi:ABC-type lipoprotein export system ATPase subunit
MMNPASQHGAAFGAGAHVVADNLVKIYKVAGEGRDAVAQRQRAGGRGSADLEVVALQGLDLTVDRGEFVAVVGPSGSGKSTLLNILGGQDAPSAGRVRVGGLDLATLDRRRRVTYRRHVIGFVWQQTGRNLVRYLTAAENIALPMVLAGVGRRARASRVQELLELVGLADRAMHRPDQLSGGEQQRVAIAVGLANRPELMLADEPTGELDMQTSAEVFSTMSDVVRQLGVTVIAVTHDPLVAAHVGRTISIRDGRTSTETLHSTGTDDQRVAEEFAVLDRAGRVQLPADYIDALQLQRRVRLALERDHVGVWPDEGGGS